MLALGILEGRHSFTQLGNLAHVLGVPEGKFRSCLDLGDQLPQSRTESLRRQPVGKHCAVGAIYKKAVCRSRYPALILVIEAKTKAISKSCQRPLGGVGF